MQLQNLGTRISFITPIPLHFITVNPFYPKHLQKSGEYVPGYVDKQELLQTARSRITTTLVLDILQPPHPDLLALCGLALLNLLAFWTGKDVARMDRLFRQSSLMRDKWDVVHDPANGRTYGQMTVDKAITDGRDTFTGKKPGAKATLPRAATAPALDDQEEGSAPPLKLPTVSPCTHLANSYV